MVHQVGAGVLGPVFRAYDPDTERTVALKSFPLDLTPEQASRLAAGLGRLVTLDLAHPSLIVPIAAGAEGSTAYLVEEYFVADSVDIALRQYGPAPVPDAVRLVGQLAGALDFAAAAGVHHGALHPRDVLVAPRDVRLTGIGVAQALESVGFRLQPRRPYSAPERSAPGEWGVAADVYSLAALAYELLTGRRPTASGDTLTVEPQAVPASDSSGLAEVFARAFTVAPGDRFPSALAFATALKHALTGQPLDASGEAERPRTRRGRPGARKAALLPLDEPPAETPAPPDGSEAAVAAAPASPPETDTTEPAVAPEAAVAPEPSPEPRPPEPVVAPQLAPERVRALRSEDRSLQLEHHPEASSDEAHARQSKPPVPPVVEQPSTLLPAEVSEVREALLAGEPELPAPPPALDDLDLRPDGREPLAAPVEESYQFHAAEAPPEEPRFTDIASEPESAPEPESAAERESASDPRFDVPSTQRPDTRRPRSFDEPAPTPQRLTPAYRPPEPPRRGSSAATMLIVAVMAIALAVAGGYYAASRYVGGGAQAPESVTPSAPDAGSGGGAAPQGQVPTPSLQGAPAEAVPPEPSLPAAEPKGMAAPAGANAPGATAPPAAAPPAPAPGTPGAGATAKREASAPAKPETGKTTSRSAKPRPVPPPAARGTAASSARRTPATVFEGSLSIVSRPAGARVFLDGHPVGTTPMTLSKLSAGSHVVRLQSEGYTMWSSAIQVAAGELNRVTASLDRLPR